MDQAQFEKELRALQGNMADMVIVEESNEKTGDDGDVERGQDDEKDAYKSTPNLYDLPIVLLWEIMESLDEDDLFSVAGTHQKLLHATKHLKDKQFDRVHCLALVTRFSPPNAQTPEVLEILLHGASVTTLYYNSDARPIDVEGLRLRYLALIGDERSPDFAAIVIEKLKPKRVILNYYTNTPRLAKTLSTIGWLALGSVGMEMLGLITEWKFEFLSCQLKNENGEMLSGFFDVISQLLDQYTKGERSGFYLRIDFQSVLQHDQLHPNVFGPDYPLQFDAGVLPGTRELSSGKAGLDAPRHKYANRMPKSEDATTDGITKTQNSFILGLRKFPGIVKVANGLCKLATARKFIFNETMPQMSTLKVPRLEVEDYDGGGGEILLKENGKEKEKEDEPPHSPLFSLSSRRLHIVIMMMGGFCCVQFITISLALTITCMVNSTAIAQLQQPDRFQGPILTTLNVSSSTNPEQKCAAEDSGQPVINDYGGSLIWDHKTQHLLFKGTFLGALLTALPAIIVLQRVSIRLIVVLSIALYSLCAVVVPYLAENHGVYAVFASRLAMGLAESFAHPSFNTLISNWFPITERSTAIALYTTGNQLATAGGNPLCAWFCSSPFGWQGVFYLSGIVGLLWCGIWMAFSANQPSKCRVMTERERKYLAYHCITRSHSKTGDAPPYMPILKSGPFLAQLQAHFFVSMVASMLQLYLPSFFKEVLQLGIMKNGIYTAIPNVAMFAWKLLWSMAMDWCKARHILTPTQAVKLSQALGCAGIGATMICIAYFADCSSPLLVLTLVTLTWCSMGFSVSGFVTSMLSIGPRYTATITAISTFTALLGRLCAPLGVGFIKKTGSRAEWQTIFLIGGCCIVFSGVLFLIFGSADVQPWAKEAEPSNEEDKEEREWEQEMLVRERRHTASISIQ